MSVATFTSALADEQARESERQELDTAKAYEALKVMRYNGAVILQFQHGVPQSIQLLRPVTWKLT